MHKKIITPVSSFCKGIVVRADNHAVVHLMRQGCSSNFFGAYQSAGGMFFSIEVNRSVTVDTAEISLYPRADSQEAMRKRYATKSTRFSQPEDVVHDVFDAISVFITSHAKEAVTVSKIPQAYMFDGVAREDIIFSPVVYEPYSDTIRTVRENYCVVAFKGGFANRQLDVDVAAKPLIWAVEKALEVGFHGCDFKRGDDYCKRRLAWLAGCFIAKQGTFEAGHLTSLMEWPKQSETQRMAA